MTSLPDHSGLLPGLPDPVHQSQQVFRAVLDAMANPGRIIELSLSLAPPAPLDIATTAVALSLIDFETPLWLDCPALADFLHFHCGCPITRQPGDAAFALISDAAALPPFTEFNLGSDEFPDRSATLIIQLPALRGGADWVLRGPGIKDSRIFSPQGLPAGCAGWVRDNHAIFPRGIDLIFTSGSALAALPRSSRLEG